MNRLASLCLAAFLLTPGSVLHAAGVTNLRCEYLENPMGIDVVKPRLSWRLETGKLKPERGIKQTAYQALPAAVADDKRMNIPGHYRLSSRP